MTDPSQPTLLSPTPPALSSEERSLFLQESIDLFSGKRQGHFIHRMYMTPASLAYWGEFMKDDGYYITRSETRIIKLYAAVIGDMAYHPEGIIGIENGPGTKSAMRAKSGVFFRAMPDLHTYIGRDWSPAIVDNIQKTMKNFLPSVKIMPDMANFLKQPLPETERRGRKVMAEFGITRGNMEGFPTNPFPDDIFRADLSFHRQQLSPGDIYVSTFDANQDGESIMYAYSSDWLTLWGRELLHSMTKELPLEGDFDPESFVFAPVWHPKSHVNTNNMRAMRRMDFSLGGTNFSIRAGDYFGITNSYKIPVELFSSIAASVGFETIGLFQDKEKRMTMAVLKAVEGKNGAVERN